MKLFKKIKKFFEILKKNKIQTIKINKKKSNSNSYGQTNYLIEFRLRGYAKKYAKAIIYDVSRKFNVKGKTKGKVVPHITLFGPFETNNQGQVVQKIVEVCKKYNRIYFDFQGFDYFDNKTNKVIYLKVKPSEDFKEFRHDLASTLTNITDSEAKDDYKGPDEFAFHSTVAFKDIDYKFDKIWNYISRKEQKKIRQTLLRVTILKNGKILYEYDFLQKRLLNRKEALSKGLWKKTIRILKNK